MGNTIIRDYIQLTKPRIAVLLVFTTVTAMVIAAEGLPEFWTLIVTILGGAFAAGGSSAVNQYYDRDMDAMMSRTAKRPIPAGRITPMAALNFGVALILISTLLLATFVNWLAASLALAGAIYYIFIYTIMLKRNTVVNIIIGGAAGAIPVLVGWAAVTGGLSVEAWLLFAIIFYWTPPHSWALALLVNADYTRAKVPMMPAARGEPTTRRQILLYSSLLVALTLLPTPIGMLGLPYLIAATLLGIGLLLRSVQLIQQKSNIAAKRMYKYSTAYLAMLCLVMIIDSALF
jgi:protoheme IX farnesyltransferase